MYALLISPQEVMAVSGPAAAVGNVCATRSRDKSHTRRNGESPPASSVPWPRRGHVSDADKASASQTGPVRRR